MRVESCETSPGKHSVQWAFPGRRFISLGNAFGKAVHAWSRREAGEMPFPMPRFAFVHGRWEGPPLRRTGLPSGPFLPSSRSLHTAMPRGVGRLEEWNVETQDSSSSCCSISPRAVPGLEEWPERPLAPSFQLHSS